jgi:aflatoxin B1 aldehyde reductase
LTLEAADKLYRAGKFKRLGLSNYTSYEVAEIVMTCTQNGWVRPTIYQAVYNCVFRTIEAELVPACRRYGLSIDAYSPTGGGFLTGKITSSKDNPQEGRFGPSQVQGWLRGMYFRDGLIEGAGLIREAAERHGINPVEVALRWVMHHSQLKVVDGDDGIVIGGSSLQQLEENLNSLEKGPLPDELVAVVEQAGRVAKGDMEVYWLFPLEYKYDTQEVLFGSPTKQD